MKLTKKEKILILAGASVHCKLVKTAQKMGFYTIVTDSVKASPAKLIADEFWDIDIFDVQQIVEKCRSECVDAVISGWIDPCQRPYVEICRELDLPCYGKKEQVFTMTDKHEFKKRCQEYGIGVIPEYSLSDISKDLVEYPVFVKPVDSRGSRGQAICNNKEELEAAISNARKESSNRDVIVEKYIDNICEIQITYFLMDGVPYVIRTADGYKGTVNSKLNKVTLCSISPSRYTKQYFEQVHDNVVKMLRGIGYSNGPAMIQGFFDNGVFRFFDPGLRFPGVDYDVLYKEITGKDIMQMLIELVLKDNAKKHVLNNADVYLDGKIGVVLFPIISSGRIYSIDGVEEIMQMSDVYAFHMRYGVGDMVRESYDVNQRFAEIDLLCKDKKTLKNVIKNIFHLLKVRDENGKNLIQNVFDLDRIE